MRKLLLFSLTAFFALGYSSAPYSQQSDWEKEQMRINKVKKVTTLIFFHPAGGSSNPTPSKFTSEFDRQGNLLKRIGYDSQSGAPLLQFNYKYNDKNHMTEYASDNEKLTISYKYVDGRMLEATIFNTNGTVKERHNYTLNSTGKVTEDAFYDGDGRFKGKREQRYDGRGNTVEYAEYDAGRKLSSRQTHTFNSKGNATETSSYGSDGRISSRITYRYDSTDRLMEKITYNGDGSIETRSSYKRDANGFVVEDSEVNAKSGAVTRTTSSYEFYQ